MRIGLGVLRLPPAILWSMTPREFAAALEGALGPTPDQDVLDRASLANLMSRYPDT
jgi:uncharacterized phage protein (TIGR02216 family)